MIEKLRQKNIHISYLKFAPEIWGIVYFATDSEYYIVINNILSPETQKKVLEHELDHIDNDLYKQGYIIGINCQHLEFEKRNPVPISKLLNKL